MTAGPPVTVVDPHGAPAPVPADRPPWPARERLLALAIGLLVAVAAAAASNLSNRPPEPYVRAVGSEVVLGNPGTLQLFAVLAGSFPPVDDARGVSADNGWQVAMWPQHLAAGTALVLLHDSRCQGLRPPEHVRISTDLGLRTLPVRTEHPLRCDPLDPLRVISSSLTAGARTTIEIRVVNASVRATRVTGFRLAGFDLRTDGPLPSALPGRDRDRPLELDRLPVHVLRLTARVVDCTRARATLDRAVRSERPDALPATVDSGSDSGTVSLTVKGLEAYLDLLQRATCVP